MIGCMVETSLVFLCTSLYKYGITLTLMAISLIKNEPYEMLEENHGFLAIAPSVANVEEYKMKIGFDAKNFS